MPVPQTGAEMLEINVVKQARNSIHEFAGDMDTAAARSFVHYHRGEYKATQLYPVQPLLFCRCYYRRYTQALMLLSVWRVRSATVMPWKGNERAFTGFLLPVLGSFIPLPFLCLHA
jgi:hypothetical protein